MKRLRIFVAIIILILSIVSSGCAKTDPADTTPETTIIRLSEGIWEIQFQDPDLQPDNVVLYLGTYRPYEDEIMTVYSATKDFKNRKHPPTGDEIFPIYRSESGNYHIIEFVFQEGVIFLTTGSSSEPTANETKYVMEVWEKYEKPLKENATKE